MTARPFFSPFWRGYRMMFPLWVGMLPFAVAYALTAKTSGLSVLETQLMSLTTFAGASQFAAAGLFGSGASGWGIVFTTFLLNARHLLYGLSLAKQLPLRSGERLLAAQFLTDEAYGMALVNGRKDPEGLSFPFLLGAELSLYTVWNASTLLGSLAGAVLPDPQVLGVGVIFPLAFLGLLVPLLGNRLNLLVAGRSGLWAGSLVAVSCFAGGPGHSGGWRGRGLAGRGSNDQITN